MFATDPRSRMLSDMAECAYRLGMAFGTAAEQAGDLKTTLEFCALFERCFFAVRVSTALELRLGREQAHPREAASDREDLSDRETLADRPDPSETERPERYTECDRDRETERASFPILLRALDGVVEAAAALPGPQPAALPTLRELLARVKSRPQPDIPHRQTLRARLTGSGAGATLALVPPPPRPQTLGPAPRRATGPPSG